MPTYQYACTSCEHEFEAVQKFSEDALSECPQCTGRLRKVFSAVGVVFKGSGFYRNDSRAKATSSEPAAKTESKPAEKKSESKAPTKSGGESAA